MWSYENIHRLIIDMSGKITGKSFTGSAETYDFKEGDWKDDLGLDSIELMELAANVNSFFQLFQMPDPPYLLSLKRVEDWVNQVYDARKKTDENICFQTSGTTGAVKSICHRIPFLEREIQFLSREFHQVTEMIPLVPSYTIYGFLFTVWLPEKLKAKLTYPSNINWNKLSPTTLIVATPFQWQWLLSSLPANQINCYGVSAAAPLFTEPFKAIQNKGIRLTEIYGSTETGGVALRHHWQDSFTLFPYWQLLKDGEDSAVSDRESLEVLPLMDIIERFNDDTFRVIGRKDKQVKIAGVLIDTDHIAASISRITNVKACTISAKSINNEVMIQAQITLDRDNEEERAAVQNRIRQVLSAPERPRSITFNLQ